MKYSLGESKIFSQNPFNPNFPRYEVFRIICEEDFVLPCGETIKKGTLGGFIDKTSVLEDNSWIFNDATVVNGSVITGNSQIGNDAVIDHSTIENGSSVSSNCYVIDSTVSGSKIKQSADVYKSIIKFSDICGKSSVEKSKVEDKSSVSDDARVVGSVITASTICDQATVENSKVENSAVSGRASVKNGCITGVRAAGDVEIKTRLFYPKRNTENLNLFDGGVIFSAGGHIICSYDGGLICVDS